MTTNLLPLGASSPGISELNRLLDDENLDSSTRCSICRTVIDFPRNLYQWCFSRPSRENLPDELIGRVLSFSNGRDLRIADSVSRVFRQEVARACEKLCRDRAFIPESLPPGVNYKHFALNRFPDAIRGDFFLKYFGNVGPVPPVPRRFIEMAPRRGFELVLIPEYITISVDPNSPLMLDTTSAVNGKKARLIADLERAPQGQAREIQVPVTLNNYIMLQTRLNINHSPQFEGIRVDSDPEILAQNGDIGVGPSHWSYQKNVVIAIDRNYNSQLEMAREKKLEMVPLVDRILFRLANYTLLGKIPRLVLGFKERTSTAINNNRHASIEWRICDPVFTLKLVSVRHSLSFIVLGAATQVPDSLTEQYSSNLLSASESS